MRFIRTPEEFEAYKADREFNVGNFGGYLRHVSGPLSYPCLVESVFTDYNDQPQFFYNCYPMNDPALLEALKYLYLTDMDKLTSVPFDPAL